MSRAARPRPLLVRRDACFTCVGDGLCCTDVHLLGPVSTRELRSLPLLPRDSVESHAGIPGFFMRTDSGRCVELGEAGCGLHARGGPLAKPSGCRRFPFGLTATPIGGRITTEHRCPCRTLGERLPIDSADAEASLRGHGGRLVVDVRVDERLRLEGRRRIPFDRYLELEDVAIMRLLDATCPWEALDVEPFAELDGFRYADVAAHLRAGADGTRAGEALALAGDVLLAHTERRRIPLRARPWKDAFDRAEARSTPIPAARVLGDFLADSAYALRWSTQTSWLGARRDLATRGFVAELVRRRVEATGVRADRAMAEGVMVAEVLGLSGAWGMVMAAFDRP